MIGIDDVSFDLKRKKLIEKRGAVQGVGGGMWGAWGQGIGLDGLTSKP